MPLGLSISYIHYIAQPIPELEYNEAVEETKWNIIAVPQAFTALISQEWAQEGMHILLPTLDQWPWNGGPIASLELIDTADHWPGATGGIASCACLSAKPQPPHSRAVTKHILNAPLSQCRASVSL